MHAATPPAWPRSRSRRDRRRLCERGSNVTEHAWPTGRLRSRRSGFPLRVVVEACAAALIASGLGAVVATNRWLAVGAVAALGALWLLVRPNLAAVALGASIPALENIAGAHLGVNVSLGDLLLLLLATSVVGSAVVSRSALVFRVLQPVSFPVLQYCAFVFVLLAAHLDRNSGIQTVQRLELLAFPLVVGSYLALKGAHVRLLQAYVVAATALAVLWPFDHLQLQKNPAGQLLANAILLLIGVPALTRLRICAPLLVYGLFATASRGAIVAGALGTAVIFLAQGVRTPRQTIIRVAVVGALVIAIFQFMPANVRTRITSFSSVGSTSAAYTVRVRETYASDALRIVRAYPWFGVGVGSYLTGVQEFHLTSSTDPHDVVLLQAAEGGWAFAGSFVVLVLGGVLALIRLRRIDLAPAALGVLVATVAHGLVDVYWVRGTPILSWLLVGMVCAGAYRARVGPAP